MIRLDKTGKPSDWQMKPKDNRADELRQRMMANGKLSRNMSQHESRLDSCCQDMSRLNLGNYPLAFTLTKLAELQRIYKIWGQGSLIFGG